MRQVKAVISDCFGVLVRGTYETFQDKYFSGDELMSRQVDDLRLMADRGVLSHQDLLQGLSELANISAAQVKYELENTRTNLALLNHIEIKLKPRLSVGMLSNASDDFVVDLFTTEQRGLFDDIVLSYEVRLAKPDERIYRLSAERLGVLPEECVFVDDIERYCTAAQDAGMQAVHYTSFAQFERDLENLLH